MNGTVLFGDVARSRRDSSGSTDWLRTLADELTAAYSERDRLAPFEFTQGDELQGLLGPGADPISAVLRASLHPDARPMRWVIVNGTIDPGRGPATHRTGPAFLRARELIREAATRRDRLLMETGDAATDALLDDVAPLLAELLGELTTRQRVIGRLIIVEGLRRSEVAARLNVKRATISVAADRAHLRGIARLATALTSMFRAGQEAAEGS